MAQTDDGVVQLEAVKLKNEKMFQSKFRDVSLNIEYCLLSSKAIDVLFQRPGYEIMY